MATFNTFIHVFLGIAQFHSFGYWSFFIGANFPLLPCIFTLVCAVENFNTLKGWFVGEHNYCCSVLTSFFYWPLWGSWGQSRVTLHSWSRSSCSYQREEPVPTDSQNSCCHEAVHMPWLPSLYPERKKINKKEVLEFVKISVTEKPQFLLLN